MKIAYVLCYRDPNYLRTITLTRALASIDGVELLIVKNKRRGPLRYVETPLRLVLLRLRHRPAISVVGFRGHEIFWALYPLLARSRIVFDEFVNLHCWLVDERKVVGSSSPLTRLIDWYVRWVLRRSAVVLEDTDAQADYSAHVYAAPRDKYAVVPVGADERIFYQRPQLPRTDGRFEVLFFGTMLPLHGMDILLGAIELLKTTSRIEGIHFTLIGGRGNRRVLDAIGTFVRDHKLDEDVTYISWVPYHELPERIATADLCIGGPLGDTPQARRVVTGKTYQFLAMGKATLVGETEARTEFIDRDNCLLVPQRSYQAVADAIVWAASHREETKEIGSRGRAYYERAFAEPKIAEAAAAALGLA